MPIIQSNAESILLENSHIRLRLPRESGPFGRQEISIQKNGEWILVAQSEMLLLLRSSGYNGLSTLYGEKFHVLDNTDQLGVVEVSGTDGYWSYRVIFSLAAGSQTLDGQVYFKTRSSQVGWVCYPITVPQETDCWTYPWVMGDHLTQPTNIGQSIGVDRPNHIWAKLAGVPAIQWRNQSGFGLIGFPLHFCYEHASLVYNPEVEDGKRLSVGYGLATGVQVEDANEEYFAGHEYHFSFQLLAGLGSFEELAAEWTRHNRFSFDVHPKYSTAELTQIIATGREPVSHQNQQRFIRRQIIGDYSVSGYASGSDDNRIIIPYLPRNACIDYGLYLRTGEGFWRERALEQMAFWLQCQSDEGWFWENWDFKRNTFFFQGFDEFGIRPDLCALSCEYALKFIRQLSEHGEPVDAAYYPAIERCLEWLIARVEKDGSIPMTYIPSANIQAQVNKTSAGNSSDTFGYRDPDTTRHNAPSPQTRLLVAFLELEHDMKNPKLKEARLAHECWVIENAYSRQCWWGHWNDTGHTATVFTALKFIEYCVRAYGLTNEKRYLDMGTETASWSFFQHVPKQLEWCRQYTRGAMIEQDNYMQYGNDVGDNLIFQTLLKLGNLTGHSFITRMGLQSIVTAQMSFCDDPRHPWYGGWGTYVADSTGLTVPFDTDPVSGVATHYNNWPGIWDLWEI